VVTDKIKMYIKNFDQQIGGGIPRGHIVLIEGGPGTMKTSIAFNMLYHNALENKLKGLYFTLEQTVPNILMQMKQLGFDYDAVKDYMVLYDWTKERDLMETPEFDATMTWKDLMQMLLRSAGDLSDYDLLVIDSINVLYCIVSPASDFRRHYFQLFQKLRKSGVTTLLIAEMNPNMPHSSDNSVLEFLVDGVIRLDIKIISDQNVQRRIRCVKMRGVDHNMGYFTLLFKKNQFQATSTIE